MWQRGCFPTKTLTRLRLRPTRRDREVAPIAGSWRALVEPSSDGTDERSKRLQEAKPYDRSQGDDSTERGRYPQPSREAFGRGDRPDVPECLCAVAADRAGSCAVLPGTSRAAAAVRGADEPDQPELCSEAGRLRSAARDTSRAIPQRPAQGRGDGGAAAPLSA